MSIDIKQMTVRVTIDECVSTETAWEFLQNLKKAVEKRGGSIGVQIPPDEATSNKAMLLKLTEFLRDLAENFDCDQDLHKHNWSEHCRACKAKALLNEAST